jgi:hypothetical protein
MSRRAAGRRGGGRRAVPAAQDCRHALPQDARRRAGGSPPAHPQPRPARLPGPRAGAIRHRDPAAARASSRTARPRSARTAPRTTPSSTARTASPATRASYSAMRTSASLPPPSASPPAPPAYIQTGYMLRQVRAACLPCREYRLQHGSPLGMVTPNAASVLRERLQFRRETREWSCLQRVQGRLAGAAHLHRHDDVQVALGLADGLDHAGAGGAGDLQAHLRGADRL